MRFSLVLAGILVYASAVGSANLIPIDTLPLPGSIPIVGIYEQLYDLCEEGGPNTYVGVVYGEDTFKTFNFTKCYPYEIEGAHAREAVFCKTVTCYNHPNADCTGGVVPSAPVPVPALTVLPNVADFVQFIGQGATCEENGLSGADL